MKYFDSGDAVGCSWSSSGFKGPTFIPPIIVDRPGYPRVSVLLRQADLWKSRWHVFFGYNHFYLLGQGYLRFTFSAEGLRLVCTSLDAFIHSITIVTRISNYLPNYSIDSYWVLPHHCCCSHFFAWPASANSIIVLIGWASSMFLKPCYLFAVT